MSAWTEETEKAVAKTLENHWGMYFPNSPDGQSQTAVCSCGGLNEFFRLEKDDDPMNRHRARVALSAISELGLLKTSPLTEEIVQPKTWAEKEVNYLRAASDPSYWDDK